MCGCVSLQWGYDKACMCVCKYSSFCKSGCQAISGLSIGTMCENDIDTENERLLCMRSAHRSNGNIYDPANPQKLISAHNACTLRRETENREEQTQILMLHVELDSVVNNTEGLISLRALPIVILS